MFQPSDDHVSDSKIEACFDAMQKAFNAGIRPCLSCGIWGEKNLMEVRYDEDQEHYFCPTCTVLFL